MPASRGPAHRSPKKEGGRSLCVGCCVDTSNGSNRRTQQQQHRQPHNHICRCVNPCIWLCSNLEPRTPRSSLLLQVLRAFRSHVGSHYFAISYIAGYNARGLRTLLSFPASALIRGSQYTTRTSYPACDTTQPAFVGGARRRPGKFRPPAPAAPGQCTEGAPIFGGDIHGGRLCLLRHVLFRCRLCLLACSVMLDQ